MKTYWRAQVFHEGEWMSLDDQGYMNGKQSPLWSDTKCLTKREAYYRLAKYTYKRSDDKDLRVVKVTVKPKKHKMKIFVVTDFGAPYMAPKGPGGAMLFFASRESAETFIQHYIPHKNFTGPTETVLHKSDSSE